MRIRFGSLFVLVAIFLCAAGARSADLNLLQNPDLDQGQGDQPSHWLTQRLMSGGGSFTWLRSAGSPGELEVYNRRFDVAQWTESITVAPGWYRLEGEVAMPPGTGNSGTALLGASVGNSTSGWGLRPKQAIHPVAGQFYFRIAQRTTVQIVCRLTGAGTASFRRLRLTAIRSAPPADAAQADFGAVVARRKANELRFNPHPFDEPTGAPWTEVALIALLAAVVIWGWRALAPDPRAKSATLHR